MTYLRRSPTVLASFESSDSTLMEPRMRSRCRNGLSLALSSPAFYAPEITNARVFPTVFVNPSLCSVRGGCARRIVNVKPQNKQVSRRRRLLTHFSMNIGVDKQYIFLPSQFREHRLSRLSEATVSSQSVEDVSLTEPPYKSHDSLMSAVLSLEGDPLQKDGGRVVTFRGNPAARLMIIGEGPGEQEDLHGLPFVGDSGELLDRIFVSGGFDVEEHVYITNVVRRRPRNNRDPTPAEISFYLPYLMEEIRLIDPAVIILAGRIAMKAVLGKRYSISRVRGQWFQNPQFSACIMPVFHPSYLLRTPSMKRDMYADIKAIRAKFEELVPEVELGPLL